MEENQYFKDALSHFISEAAYAGAVRHLYDLGYSCEKIKANLTYPASEEQIRKVIEDYEKKRKDPEQNYDYVQDTDAYGKKTFRKVFRD